jgi:polyphenol oxidase
VPGRVRAAFTLRTGGVSVAPYDSLNMGAAIGDSLEAVAENRRRVREALRLPGEPGWLEQVHGVNVVALGGRGEAGVREVELVDAGRRDADGAVLPAARGAAAVGPRAEGAVRVGQDCFGGGLGVGTGGAELVVAVPRGDASVAWAPGQVCAIRVADCMPVLFAAVDGSVVGAAHAGWRGLAGGVLEATVARMGVSASRLIAWMGPAIGQANFEVGDDVRTAFVATDAAASSAFIPNARRRWQCDLYALARRRLAALGVAGVYGGGWCTFAESERFFSYRRSGQCGRMAALIWIEAGARGG